MLYSGLTSRQIAWIRSVEASNDPLSGDTVAFFIAHTPPATVRLYDRETGVGMYAPTLSAYIVSENRFEDSEEAEACAKEMADKWKAEGLTKNIELPAWLLDFSARDSLEEQTSLMYRLRSITDLRGLYVDESVGASDFIGDESLMDAVAYWLNPDNKMDATLQPLVDAIPEYIRTALADDEQEEGDEDEEYLEEIRLAWWKAGFTGYLVQVSTPVREYLREDSNAATFSWGYTVGQVMYLDDLADRAPIEAWVREVIEEFKAVPRPKLKRVKSTKLDPVLESSED